MRKSAYQEEIKVDSGFLEGKKFSKIYVHFFVIKRKKKFVKIYILNYMKQSLFGKKKTIFISQSKFKIFR